MKYTSFVPARSGSKRLPHKNIKILGSKPLFIWSLEASIKSDKIETVILSTDSEEYWELAQKAVSSEKLVLDFRDPEEAGDTVKIFDYLKQKRSKIFNNRQGAFILTLPTVPFRTTAHIEEAITLFEESKKPVFSATEYGFAVSFAFSIDDDSCNWKPVFDDSPLVTGNTRSQNQRKMYHPNGAIYVRNIEDLASDELTTLYQNANPYLMDRASSIDIDSMVDFKIAEALL